MASGDAAIAAVASCVAPGIWMEEYIASVDVELTPDDVRELEAPYTRRYDWQGISDEAELEAIRRRVPGMAL
jgi:hypothetical protein